MLMTPVRNLGSKVLCFNALYVHRFGCLMVWDFLGSIWNKIHNTNFFLEDKITEISNYFFYQTGQS